MNGSIALTTTETDKIVTDEEQLIQLAKNDPAAFAPLYDRYYESVFRFIRMRTDNTELAEDICADVFIKALKQIKKFEYRGIPLGSWLLRIARNEVYSHYKKSKQLPPLRISPDELENLAKEEINETELPLEQLAAALDSLSKKDLELIEMKFFEQRSFREIGQIISTTEGTARVKTHRAVQKLRKFFHLK